jgi:hypothetical protein
MKDVLRDTWKTPRLWMIDARIWFLLPFLIVGIHIWKIIAFLLAIGLLVGVEKIFGLSVTNAWRAMWAAVLGKHRPARPAIRRRRVLDYTGVPNLNLFEDGE